MDQLALLNELATQPANLDRINNLMQLNLIINE